MASTLTVQQVVNWASTHNKLMPIVGVGGYQNEPALSIANDVLQEMFKKPYAWKFNQSFVPQILTSVTLNQQDYPQNITDCAWFESATWTDVMSTQQPQPIDNLQCVHFLQPTSLVDTPKKVCYFNENDSGITVRFWPIPPMSQQYGVNIVYQKKPTYITVLSQTWYPVPDELAYVIRQGFLAMAYKFSDDPRFQEEYMLFQQLMMEATSSKDAETDGMGLYPANSLMVG